MRITEKTDINKGWMEPRSKYFPSGEDDLPPEGYRTSLKPYAKGLKPKFISEEMATVWEKHFSDDISLVSIGLVAILWAVEDCGCEEIYCVGIDFFEDGEYLTKELSQSSKERQANKSSQMKERMVEIAELYPETEFHFITDADFNPPLPNIYIHRGGESPI